MNTVVLGVSRDSVKSHQRFKSKLEIPFTLLSDPDGAVCKKYGVIKEKSMFGKIGLGIVRSTFVIDKKGVVREVYRGVKVQGHVEEVLEAVRGLG